MYAVCTEGAPYPDLFRPQHDGVCHYAEDPDARERQYEKCNQAGDEAGQTRGAEVLIEGLPKQPCPRDDA